MFFNSSRKRFARRFREEVRTQVFPALKLTKWSHVPDAFELYGLEKTSKALLSGQWSGTSLISVHFGLGPSDQTQFQGHTSLIRGRFELFFPSFFFYYLQMLSLLRVSNKAAFWSELYLKIWWSWSGPRSLADSNCRSPQETNLES